MAGKTLLNEIKVSIILSRLCQQLIERHKDFSNVVLVGLQPRGTSLLEQLLKLLREQGLKSIKSGKLDITFFRDDFRRSEDVLIPNKTEFKLLVEDKHVVFIDDVLYTGRTIRAALTAIETFGRPKTIELLVLVDRRFSRELPIQPDYKGIQVDVYEDQKVNVGWNNKKFGNYIYLENIENG